MIVPISIALLAVICLAKKKEYMSTPEEDVYVHRLTNLCDRVIDDEVKNVPVKPYNASFTEDKKKIFVCVKNKKGKFFSENDMMYVMLHEYAHATTKDKENPHGPKWKANFQRYLKIAEEMGLYNPAEKLSAEYMTECAG